MLIMFIMVCVELGWPFKDSVMAFEYFLKAPWISSKWAKTFHDSSFKVAPSFVELKDEAIGFQSDFCCSYKNCMEAYKIYNLFNLYKNIILYIFAEGGLHSTKKCRF